jgi:hypothetical protein
VVFVDNFIPKNPAVVAHATKGSHETWTNLSLRDAIFGSATKGTRRNIRTTNPSIAHPHIRWSLEPTTAKDWKESLVSEMKKNGC